MPVREWEEIQEMLWRANDESIIRQAPRSPEGLRIGCRRCLTILSHQRELNLRKTPSRQGENHGVLHQITVIESVGELSDVPLQMLHADAVERAYHSALEQRPEVLNRVRVNIASHPLSFYV